MTLNATLAIEARVERWRQWARLVFTNGSADDIGNMTDEYLQAVCCERIDAGMREKTDLIEALEQQVEEWRQLTAENETTAIGWRHVCDSTEAELLAIRERLRCLPDAKILDVLQSLLDDRDVAWQRVNAVEKALHQAQAENRELWKTAHPQQKSQGKNE